MERDEEFINKIALGCQVELDEVRQEWDAVVDDTFVQSAIASGRMSEVQILTYVKTSVQSRFTSLKPAEPQNFVVVGFSGSRKPKSGGDWYSELFGVFPDRDSPPKIRRIQVTGDHEVYKEMSFDPPTYFEGVRLVAYDDGGYQADRRANFSNGQVLSEEEDWLAFVPKVKISDIPRNLSRRQAGGSSSWEDPTDWKAIEGVVVLGTTRSGDRADGSGSWGGFEINDMSLMTPVNIDSKTILNPALTCWCAKELVPVEESMVVIMGPVSKVKPSQDGSRQGGYSMNVKLVQYLIRRDPPE